MGVRAPKTFPALKMWERVSEVVICCARFWTSRAKVSNILASCFNLITQRSRLIMPNVSTNDVIAEAEQIARVWTENKDFALGEMTLPKLQKMIADLRDSRSQIEDTRTQLTALTNESNEQAAALNQINTRALSGFRAIYGPNSTQYEQAGGTRSSERKRPTRKPKG
jgi:hypothetical protein